MRLLRGAMGRYDRGMAIVRSSMIFVLLAGIVVPMTAMGQRAPSGGSRRQGDYTAPPVDRTPSVRDSTPRLEAGALLCPTEEALQRYQAMVLARAEGREAPAGRGCRLVQRSTIVTVVERRSGRIHVKLAPPASPDNGWTDAALPG